MAAQRPAKFCAVCGDRAIACNFNALTCESCKAFFRRNAYKEARLKCLFERRCEVTRVTRRFCSSCRLLKCFAIGMKREWILTDEQKRVKRVRVQQNRQSRASAAQPQQPPPSDGLAHLPAPRGPPPPPAGRLQTRDAATCCDLAPEPAARLYCAFADQCDFCHFRLAKVYAPPPPPPMTPTPLPAGPPPPACYWAPAAQPAAWAAHLQPLGPAGAAQPPPPPPGAQQPQHFVACSSCAPPGRP